VSIIANTYFNSDINLTSTQITNVVDSWLDIYEEMILKKLLGYDLWVLYDADLNKDGAIDEPVAQRFKDLVDGKAFTFEYGGATISTKWQGLRDTTLLKSLIGYYVYFNYRNEEETFNSSAGQKIGLTENSNNVSAVPKLINTWNKMVEWYGQIPTELVYPELFLDNSNYIHRNSYPSAYNFLLANIDTYPEWVFEPLDRLNIFGI